MTTSTVPTIAEICAKYNLTPEQFARATHCECNGAHFYIVESLSTPGQEYRVEWNTEHGCLQCMPHNGEACKASVNGISCWHKRAALAAEEHYKAQRHQECMNEQATIEATQEYQFEQLFRELEDTLDALDALTKEADARDQARRDAQRTAYNNFALSMGF